MCVETMDTTSKRTKADCLLRKTAKPGSQFRWRPLRLPAEVDEAYKPYRGPAVWATVRKCLHREHKRTQLENLVLRDVCKKRKKRESSCVESPAAHPGAMAPENTTQYLMSNVYEDMRSSDGQAAPASCETSAHLYSESMSPRSVYAALDSGFESCLAFQQRDFEDMFGQCW